MTWTSQKCKEMILGRHCKLLEKYGVLPLDYLVLWLTWGPKGLGFVIAVRPSMPDFFEYLIHGLIGFVIVLRPIRPDFCEYLLTQYALILWLPLGPSGLTSVTAFTHHCTLFMIVFRPKKLGFYDCLKAQPGLVLLLSSDPASQGFCTWLPAQQALVLEVS